MLKEERNFTSKWKQEAGLECQRRNGRNSLPNGNWKLDWNAKGGTDGTPFQLETGSWIGMSEEERTELPSKWNLEVKLECSRRNGTSLPSGIWKLDWNVRGLTF
ncbi:hypothetical protein BV898_17604 [Hypsibius exemplaris]|uniref:Uncharacterized protein n=1 Tax=Hypsibius exemplaris TaxID=2072580 RepID=A0A9X6NFW3_HYPEX|nr:hypothetical protein BV898_17604 [Hypsibius exemplaris]